MVEGQIRCFALYFPVRQTFWCGGVAVLRKVLAGSWLFFNAAYAYLLFQQSYLRRAFRSTHYGQLFQNG